MNLPDIPSPNTGDGLSELAEKVRALRTAIIMDSESIGSMSMEHRNAALAALEMAASQLQMCAYVRMRGD